MQTIETDVLVVGAGPAGSTAAALLARSGVQALTVTKYGATADSPRAHISDGTAFPPIKRDADLYYHPTTHPGAALLHNLAAARCRGHLDSRPLPLRSLHTGRGTRRIRPGRRGRSGEPREAKQTSNRSRLDWVRSTTTYLVPGGVCAKSATRGACSCGPIA